MLWKQPRSKLFKPQVKSRHGANCPKRCAPCGHRSNSRRRPEEISQLIDIYPDKCDRCGDLVNGYPNTFDERVIVEETDKLAPHSIDGRFCEELKTVFKQTINAWNEYRRGMKILQDLAKEKGQAISRFVELLLLPIKHKDIRNLRRRIIKHNQELFTFLDNPVVEPTNNRAERQLRPIVIMRKVTFGSRSALGALNQAVIMSIIQTGVLNGIEPLDICLALSFKPLTSLIELPRPRPP
jgi:hypothetical protein